MPSDINEGQILWGMLTYGNFCGWEGRVELGVVCSSSWSYEQTSPN